MRLPCLVALCLLSVPATAQEQSRAQQKYQRNGHLLLGLRGGAFPYGAAGTAPTLGVDCGVLIPEGMGFGLQGLLMPGPELSTGLLANLRVYTDKVEPLTLYGSLAAGFVSGAIASPKECGPASENNPVECGPRPTVNPGVGALWRGQNIYAGLEMSLMGLKTPFLAVSLGLDFELLPTQEI